MPTRLELVHQGCSAKAGKPDGDIRAAHMPERLPTKPCGLCGQELDGPAVLVVAGTAWWERAQRTMLGLVELDAGKLADDLEAAGAVKVTGVEDEWIPSAAEKEAAEELAIRAVNDAADKVCTAIVEATVRKLEGETDIDAAVAQRELDEASGGVHEYGDDRDDE